MLFEGIICFGLKNDLKKNLFYLFININMKYLQNIMKLKLNFLVYSLEVG